VRHDLLSPNYVLKRKWLVVETFLVVVVLVAIVEENQFLCNITSLVICGTVVLKGL